MENCANILLLGKTGVGKSSFINYFIGKPLAKVGGGRPVTQEYFIPYEVADGNYPIQIFDTKGLEAMDANVQLNEIVKSVKERNNSDNVLNWFHTIFYCVSMENPRFEDFEAKLIRKLRSEISQNIHIILTQCDADTSGEKISTMRRKISHDVGDMEGIQIFEVVSISKKKRNGEVVEPRGKEEISESVFELLVKDIAKKVSIKYANALWMAWRNMVWQISSEINSMIDEKVKLKTLLELIKDEDQAFNDMENYVDGKFANMESQIEEIQEKTDEQFTRLLRPVGQLYASYYGLVTDSYVDHAQLSFMDADDWIDYNWLDELDEEDFVRYLMPKLRKYVDSELRYKGKSNLWDYGHTFGKAADDFFHFKSNLKKMVNDMMSRLMKSMPSRDEIQAKASDRIVDYLTL